MFSCCTLNYFCISFAFLPVHDSFPYYSKFVIRHRGFLLNMVNNQSEIPSAYLVNKRHRKFLLKYNIDMIYFPPLK